MKAKIILLASSLFALAGPAMAQCNDGKAYSDLEVPCYKTNITEEFISDGNRYREFLEGGVMAEFPITFFGGTTYRFIACSDLADTPLTFIVEDFKGNVLFTNEAHDNSQVWDLEFNATIDCRLKFHFAGQEPTERGSIINPNDTLPDSLKVEEEKTEGEATISGCGSVMIAFKQ